MTDHHGPPPPDPFPMDMPPHVDPHPMADMAPPPVPDHHLAGPPDAMTSGPVDPVAAQGFLDQQLYTDQQNQQLFLDPPDPFAAGPFPDPPDPFAAGAFPDPPGFDPPPAVSAPAVFDAGYHPPDPPGSDATFTTSDLPGFGGGHVPPDPPGFDAGGHLPDPPGPDGGYVPPDPPGADAHHPSPDLVGSGGYLPPDPPGFDGYLPPDPPGFDGYLPPDPPGFDGDRQLPDPPGYDPAVAPATTPVSLVQPAPVTTPAAGEDAFSRLRPGEQTWLDGSYSDDRAFVGFDVAPHVVLTPDPSTRGQWLVQVEDPHPPERHLTDRGRDLGTGGMGVVDDRQMITIAVIETPDGGAPSVGLMRGLGDHLTVVVQLPPGGTMAETAAPVNRHIDIYGFAGRAPDATPAPAPPAPPGQPPSPAPAGVPVPPDASSRGSTPTVPEPPAVPAADPGHATTSQHRVAEPVAPPFPEPAVRQAQPHAAGHLGRHDDRLDLDWSARKTGPGDRAHVHAARAKEPEGKPMPPTGRGSGPHGADPDGVIRVPGRTSLTALETPSGTHVLRNAETTLATDPSFRDVARAVRDRMRSDSYGSYQKTLSAEIKQILRGAGDHPLKRILELRGDAIHWRAGTTFAEQELHFAHTLSRQSIRNIDANSALAADPANLEPVGHTFHLREYGHVYENATGHMAAATEDAQVATRAGTRDLALSKVRRGRAGQAGFIEIRGMIFLEVVAAGVVVVLRGSADRTEAIGELVKVGADMALQSVLVRTVGGGPAFAVSVVLGMYSDDPVLNREHAVETAQREAAEKFIDRFVPEAVTVERGVLWDTRRYDPEVVRLVHLLLFTVPPSTLEKVRG